MKKIGLSYVLISSLIYGFDARAVGPTSWQKVYVVNNSDVDLQVAADVTGAPRAGKINYTAQGRPRHKQTWFVPKKGKEFGGVANLGKLNRLHNVSIKPQVYNMSTLPTWMQSSYPIQITQRQPGKVLIIYIGKTDTKWLTEQLYVTAVKTVYDEGSAGYRLRIDQP